MGYQIKLWFDYTYPPTPPHQSIRAIKKMKCAKYCTTYCHISYGATRRTSTPNSSSTITTTSWLRVVPRRTMMTTSLTTTPRSLPPYPVYAPLGLSPALRTASCVTLWARVPRTTTGAAKVSPSTSTPGSPLSALPLLFHKSQDHSLRLELPW